MGVVRFRPGRVEDVPALAAIYNHYVRSSPATFEIAPVSLDNRLAWFGHYASIGPHRLFVAERDGRAVGYATSSPFHARPAYSTSVETSVYVAPDALGQSVGSGLYAALFAAIAGEDLHRAYAGMTLPNPGSYALHRRFGFAEVGVYRDVGRKFDRYWDVQWFEKALPHVS